MRLALLLLLLTLTAQAEPRIVSVVSDPPGARVYEDTYDPARGTGYLGVTPCQLWLEKQRSYELFLVKDGYLTGRCRVAPGAPEVSARLEPGQRPVLWPLLALLLLPALWLRRRSAAPPSLPGPQLAGDYELLEVLGEGGSARVYRARHRDYGDEFALKLWRSDQLDPASVDRFRREIEAGTRLRHPNLLRVLAGGLCDRGAFVVSELLDGTTLEDRLDEPRLAWLEPIARGLEALHAAGLVHRDLKPANVMITSRGEVKILDYGMVRVLGANLTLPGGALGTPHYMAPENVLGEAGTAADLYSLGVLAFRLASGRLPFPGDDAVAVMTAQLYQPAPPLEVGPPELRELVAALLDKRPENRPTATLVARRLKEMSDVE